MATKLSTTDYITGSSIDKTSLLKTSHHLPNIRYGCRSTVKISKDSTNCSITIGPAKSATHPPFSIHLTINKLECILELTEAQLQQFSSSTKKDQIEYNIPIITELNNILTQTTAASEDYESLLNRNSPLSLKYLCREYILFLISRSNQREYLFHEKDKMKFRFDVFHDNLLKNQCYWKELQLPLPIKLYLNGCMPISTQAKLIISIVRTSSLGSPYDLRVLPVVELVQIDGGQWGTVSVTPSLSTTDRIEKCIISPADMYGGRELQTRFYWILTTVTPNHFIFESPLYPNRYIFAPDPTGKTYSRGSTLFLSRPFYVGPENIFTFVPGGTPYYNRRSPCIGIKSVKWSTADTGMFWRWQPDHYHLASKHNDMYQGDECYWITTVSKD